MTGSLPTLADGYANVPPGKLANAVTCLEMLEKPPTRESRAFPNYSLNRVLRPDAASYRSLFRQVGEDWMWVSRLMMSDEELLSIIHDPRVEYYELRDETRVVGMLELDFREADCEIAFFGLIKDAIGKGAGRFLMDQALSIAWSHPVRRVWLHTCHFDSPGAIAFYIRSGFKPYAFMVEVTDDPRLIGILPRSVAPHIPLLG